MPRFAGAVPGGDVLVLDDNSPDGTGLAADALATDPRIHVIHRGGKLGLGTAILAMIAFAMENHYDLLVTMDADLTIIHVICQTCSAAWSGRT